MHAWRLYIKNEYPEKQNDGVSRNFTMMNRNAGESRDATNFCYSLQPTFALKSHKTYKARKALASNSPEDYININRQDNNYTVHSFKKILFLLLNNQAAVHSLMN